MNKVLTIMLVGAAFLAPFCAECAAAANPDDIMLRRPSQARRPSAKRRAKPASATQEPVVNLLPPPETVEVEGKNREAAETPKATPPPAPEIVAFLAKSRPIAPAQKRPSIS